MSEILINNCKLKAAVVSSYAYIRGHNNYGSLFQYYALQQYLKKFGIEVYWVRFMFPSFEMYKSLFKRFVCSVLHGTGLRNTCNHILTQRAFRSYMHTHCNLSPKKYLNINKLKQNPPVADIYITGSDQVWGGWLEPNYLTFAPKEKKKIAYAVSFGKRELSIDHQKHIIDWVKVFDAVSVREKSGVEICKKMGVQATHLLDPTLLLDDDEYLSSCSPRMEKCNYVFCYFINEKSSENLRLNNIITFCHNKSLKLRITGIEGSETVIPQTFLYQYSPEEWLNHYKYAECILTNTFHGTVFCIIFKRPFCVFLQKGISAKQNERIYSLLEMFDLQDRILRSEDSIEAIMAKEIDWAHVELIKKKLRANVYQFWKQSLKDLL